MKATKILYLSLFFATHVAFGQADLHEWKNVSGRTIKAKFIQSDADTVTLFMKGRDFVVKLSDLKPDSQTLARKLSTPEPSIEPKAAVKEKKSFPEIRVIKADWGGASLRDIGKVLNSSARQLWAHASQEELKPIIVDRSRTGPIVLFRRGNEGQYIVRLDTHKTFWSQYAFQFSHEFCHIMCGYKAGDQSNQWFEESLCETASLFAMRRMRKEWEEKPPYPNWKSYAPALEKYAQERLDSHAWPDSLTVVEWYDRNKEKLKENPTDREKNTTIATKLLPLFEQRPGNWGAVAFLNVHKTKDSRSFSTYLADWRRACKLARDKEFVSELARMFGVEKS